jgi:alpha-galactosidase
MAVSPFLFLVLLVLLPPLGARGSVASRPAAAPLRIAPLPTAALRRLYDTSNYGRLQLNNGLALAPQMG